MSGSRVPEWEHTDPLSSVQVGLLTLYSSWNLLRPSASALMEHALGGIKVDEVRDMMMSATGAADVLRGIRAKLRQDSRIDFVPPPT